MFIFDLSPYSGAIKPRHSITNKYSGTTLGTRSSALNKKSGDDFLLTNKLASRYVTFCTFSGKNEDVDS